MQGPHSPPRDAIAVSSHQPVALKDRGVDAALWILCMDILAAILWNSLGTPPVVFSLPNADKVLHLSSYFSLTFLLLLAGVWRPGRGPGRVSSRLLLFGVAAFGVAIEAAQGLVFERTADVLDALANLIGIGLAWLLWRAMQRSSLSDQ